MNRSIIFLSAFVLFAATACKQGFEKIPDSEVNTEQKNAAHAFATRILKAHEEGKFAALPESQATADFRKAFDPAKQKSSHESIKGLWGDFVSARYIETAKPKDGTLLRLYRFRGKFKGAAVEPEIRVVYDGQGKISGFWLKSWHDTVQ